MLALVKYPTSQYFRFQVFRLINGRNLEKPTAETIPSFSQLIPHNNNDAIHFLEIFSCHLLASDDILSPGISPDPLRAEMP
jgi:hypothetical protein